MTQLLGYSGGPGRSGHASSPPGCHWTSSYLWEHASALCTREQQAASTLIYSPVSLSHAVYGLIPTATRPSMSHLFNSGFGKRASPLGSTLRTDLASAANSPPSPPGEPDARHEEFNGTSGGGERKEGRARLLIHEELIWFTGSQRQRWSKFK